MNPLISLPNTSRPAVIDDPAAQHWPSSVPESSLEVATLSDDRVASHEKHGRNRE